MDRAFFQIRLQHLLEQIRSYLPGFNVSDERRIEEAFWFGFDAHDGQENTSGEPYYVHPIEATFILLEIKPDIETIQTCLLHDVLEYTSVDAKEIQKQFGNDVLHMCEAVGKVAKVHLDNNASTEKGLLDIQKLFMAVAEDIRVLFVKVADRIQNLETLHVLDENRQKRISEESIKIYAPVCDKLGLHSFKDKIEDLSFAYQNKDMYTQIDKEIRAFKDKKERIFSVAYDALKALFDDTDIEVLDIVSRQKNIYSVYQKMKRKNLTSSNEMFDVIGFRILVADHEACYRALGKIHATWSPMPGRFKDYIGVPRANGYQSLHTTVLGLGGSRIPTEIQIKTPQMHMDAEYGPAAHWAYKMNKGSHFDENYLKRSEWFPDHIKKGKDLGPQEFYSHVAKFLFKERVIVFTPKGEVKTLSMGSTPVDFAYAIHSEVGDMCAGAVVNGDIKPLDYVLKNGDIVNILTKKGKNPNPEWLKFIKTRHARDYIQAFVNKSKAKLATHVENEEENERVEKPSKKTKFIRPKRGGRKISTKAEIIIGGHRDIPYKFCPCCKPKVGDKIIAYKNRGLQYVVYRIDCHLLEDLEPERFMEACYCLRRTFEIVSYSRIGMLRQYMTLIGKYDMNILYSESKVDRETNVATTTFTLQTCNNSAFPNFIRDIEHLEETQSITEIEDKGEG